MFLYYVILIKEVEIKLISYNLIFFNLNQIRRAYLFVLNAHHIVTQSNYVIVYKWICLAISKSL